MGKASETQLEDWHMVSPMLEELRPIFSAHEEPVFLVGGAIRDLFLKRDVFDFDFAVSKNAVDLAFQTADSLGYPAYVLDRERDAGRVVISDRGITLDFAAFRHSTLKEDLYKRDFTINAMAVPALQVGKRNLIDPFGGAADLIARRIRITNPDAISDDPVRVLRAIRFVNDINFELTSETVKSIERSCQDIVKVSGERVRDELLKILATGSPHSGLRLLSDLWILDYVLPEIADLIGKGHEQDDGFDSFDQTVSRFEYLAGMNTLLSSKTIAEELPIGVVLASLLEIVPDLAQYFDRRVNGGVDGWTVLRLGALFFDIGLSMEIEDERGRRNVVWVDRQLPVDLVENRMQALRMSREAIRHVRTVITHRKLLLKLATKEALLPRDVYRYFLSTGSAGIDVAWLTIADQLARNNGDLSRDSGTRLISTVRLLLENYFLRYEISIKPTPLVDGSVLIDRLNIDPGPEIGRLLAIIEEAQAVGEVTTLDEAILLAERQQAVN